MIKHLDALLLRLSNERARLAATKSPNEIELRKVWIAGIEKEIAQEEAFLHNKEPATYMTDDELLAELAN
jgi:hypothetical protein